MNSHNDTPIVGTNTVSLTLGVFLGESEAANGFLFLGDVRSFCKVRRLLADSGERRVHEHQPHYNEL